MGVIEKGIPRGCQGLFTPVSLGYPLSVFNKKTVLSNPDACWEHVVVKRASVPLGTHKGNTTARASSAKVVRQDIFPHYLGTSPAQHPNDPRPIQPGLVNTIMGKCHCATFFLLDTETVLKLSKKIIIVKYCGVSPLEIG